MNKNAVDFSSDFHIQNISVKNLANQIGTPFYLYDGASLIEQYQHLKNCFGDKVDIFYSLKANPNISICNIFLQSGAHAEVCSLAELETAVQAGFKPQNIIFVGPYKSNAVIERCLELNIYAIVCESKTELAAISFLAQKKNTIAKVALRINPDFSVIGAALKMGGRPTQFGIDYQELLAEENWYLSRNNTRIIGIHIYVGTRILAVKTIVDNTLQILSLAKYLQERWQSKFSMIGIGGGIGIPYFSGEQAIDLPELQIKIQKTIQLFSNEFSNARIILESGRFLVGPSGYFVVAAKNIKKSKGENFVITDGGLNYHFSAVTSHSFINRNFPIQAIVNKSKYHCLERYTVTGPLCTPNDQIAKDILLPPLEENDLIIIRLSGAYGITASPMLFLSYGYPNEVLIENQTAYILRKQDQPFELFSKQTKIILEVNQ